MLLQILLILLVGISLTGCPGGAPAEPDIELCQFIAVYVPGSAPQQIDFDQSYEKCVSHLNPDDPKKQRKVPLKQYLAEVHPISLSGDDYTKEEKWGDDLDIWGSDHCK